MPKVNIRNDVKSYSLNGMMKNREMILRVLLILSCVVLLVLSAIYSYLIARRKTLKKEKEDFIEKTKIEVIFVYSKSCPYCVRFEPIFDSAIGKYSQNVNQYALEVKKVSSTEVDDRYSFLVQAYPTVLVFIGNNYIKKLVGYKNEADVYSFLKSI